MKAKSSFYLLFIILFPILSCKKDKSPGPKTEGQVDVYLAGYVQAKNGRYVAAYWKNGVITKLTDSVSDSFGNNIVVNGTDVYVTGSVDTKGATYWKNGKPVILTTTSGITNAIAISGSDVYVAGASKGYCYWKNGTIIRLPTPRIYNSTDINSIAVKGNDVYVVGGVYANNGNSVATYWKNGIPKRLVDSTMFSYAKGIAIQGNDVYISGYTTLSTDGFEVGTYWKNDEQHSLSGDHYSEAISIVVSGSDIYLGGHTLGSVYNTTVATYWKNGAETRIGSEAPGNYASNIQVSGTDIYILAYDGINKVYWKNNKPVPYTTDHTANVYAMVVVPR